MDAMSVGVLAVMSKFLVMHRCDLPPEAREAITSAHRRQPLPNSVGCYFDDVWEVA